MRKAPRVGCALLWLILISACGCMTTRPAIPPRAADALTGSAFIREVAGLPLDERDARIFQEITQGNLPGFLRRFVPVAVSAGSHHGRYDVTPDYLSVGSDADFVRMPMMPTTAQAIAERFGCVLPTRKMVDDIYARAAVKLEPAPFSPKDHDIASVDVFRRSHERIEEQRAGWLLGLLVAGIKKNVVVTPQLAGRPGRVAIYGWHRPDGKPIQPLYLGHTARWVDYSHGIRLIAGTMEVDGMPMRVIDVLKNPELSGLLSDEGAFEYPRYTLPSSMPAPERGPRTGGSDAK